MFKGKGSGAGGWLIGTTLASMVAAFVVVRLFDYFFVGPVAAAVRPGVFAGIWTGVSTKLGLRAFSERMRGLRRHTRGNG